MEKIIIKNDDMLKEYDIEEIRNKNFYEKLKYFSDLDSKLTSINRIKYDNAKEILYYLDKLRVPKLIEVDKINLLTLLNFFQKKFVYKPFKLDLKKYPEKVQKKIGYSELNIAVKPNNFPHLIGIRGERNELGKVINREKPKEFLDGILYQWILLNAHEGFELDIEKLTVFHWIHSTITSPTYILTETAIKKNGTKFNADIILVKKIFNSQKQSYHIVGLKQEEGSRYTFNSQFGISKAREKRFYTMFDTKKAIYDFFKK